MTTQELLQKIHKKLERNTEYPEAGSEDFIVRVADLEEGISVWANEEGESWKELFQPFTASLVENEDTIPLPESFKSPAGFLRIYDGTELRTRLPYKPAHEFNALIEENANFEMYTVIGGESDYSLVISPIPTVANGLAGKTIKLNHYKTAQMYSDGTEKIEMSDPYFLYHYVLAQQMMNNPTAYTYHTQVWQNKLQSMVSANTAIPPFQDETIDDYRVIGFGI